MEAHTKKPHHQHRFTIQIIIGMLLGIVFGLLIKWIPFPETIKQFLITDVLHVGGKIFIRLIQLIVVPIVLTSLICGSSSLGDVRRLGKIGAKTLGLYIITTALAITIAIVMATIFQTGAGLEVAPSTSFSAQHSMSITEVLINLFPTNPFKAMADGNMLQVIVFALLFGLAITAAGKIAEPVAKFLNAANEVLLKLIMMIMKLAPLGVFFLLANLFAKIGFSAISHLIGYFFTVLAVLAVQLFVVYSVLLSMVARLNPLTFFRKMYSTMIFAFSIASSNASIPMVLRSVEYRLGVGNSVASFVIPLGATINMDGTAIMQGVATVFIAHAYHISIGITGYLTVIGMATLASIGTAGVPSVGLITLTMVLRQVGLPVEGIGMIIGIDRLLDMVRTAVNISGDSVVACLVGKSEGVFNREIYNNLDDEDL